METRKYVIEPRFDTANPFLEGIAEAALMEDCRDGGDVQWFTDISCTWSKIDKTGKIIR